MKIPNLKEDWEHIIELRNKRWHFPNYFVAFDSKHVGIICPEYSGSEIYNYKGFYSIILLAFPDYNYKFLTAEGRCQVRKSDGSVY